jgi:hypothetical protein
MNVRALRHWRRDSPLVFLLTAVLLVMGGFLGDRVLVQQGDLIQGWRRIDTEALMQRIGSGDLQRTEARWYRVIPEEGETDRWP